MSTIATMTAENIRMKNELAELQKKYDALLFDVTEILSIIPTNSDSDKQEIWENVVAFAKQKYPKVILSESIIKLSGVYKWQEENQSAGKSTIV
jgi:hypothetical protein